MGLPPESFPKLCHCEITLRSALGIEEKTHDAMFDAVWNTGELAVSDPITHQLKKPLPSIEDIARFYARTAGVKPETFLATAK